MDRLIYTAMTGAKHVFMQQAGTANNLANASTIGFKAQEHRFRAVPVLGEGMPTTPSANRNGRIVWKNPVILAISGKPVRGYDDGSRPAVSAACWRAQASVALTSANARGTLV